VIERMPIALFPIKTPAENKKAPDATAGIYGRCAEVGRRPGADAVRRVSPWRQAVPIMPDHQLRPGQAGPESSQSLNLELLQVGFS
jgi:hypothetical protein